MPKERRKPKRRAPLRSIAGESYNAAATEAALRPYPLPHRIVTLRAMFDLSQEEMAQLLNVERNTISNWEAGLGNPRRVQPSNKARRALAYVFGLPASFFADDLPASSEEVQGAGAEA
jgi:DNA-binding XRE family transcriptional regulator